MDPAKGMRNHNKRMEEYGMRWLQYVKVVTANDVWTTACDKAAAKLMPKGELSILVTTMALATKGVAECQAISLLACKELQAVGPYMVHICPDSPLDDQTRGLMERISHLFYLRRS